MERKDDMKQGTSDRRHVGTESVASFAAAPLPITRMPADLRAVFTESVTGLPSKDTEDPKTNGS